MSGWRLIHIPEPRLQFGFGQMAEHPKDGLLLYGPPSSNLNPARMDVGVIGTTAGIERYRRWVRSIGSTIAPPDKGKPENKMFWPGFEAVFGAPWPEEPYASCVIDGAELSRRIRIENRHEAISEAAKFYGDTLRRHLDDEEARPKLWFAILPEEVFRYGRPKSVVPRELREKSSTTVSRKYAKSVIEYRFAFRGGCRGRRDLPIRTELPQSAQGAPARHPPSHSGRSGDDAHARGLRRKIQALIATPLRSRMEPVDHRLLQSGRTPLARRRHSGRRLLRGAGIQASGQREWPGQRLLRSPDVSRFRRRRRLQGGCRPMAFTRRQFLSPFEGEGRRIDGDGHQVLCRAARQAAERAFHSREGAVRQ